MKKRILITGACSGFGEGAAIGLAKKGHDVIAGAHIWPQVTKMRKQAEALGLKNLRVEKLDILDPYDVYHALTWDIDILFNNAAIGYCGPIAEIPLDLVDRTFETNVFATLNLTQQFVRKFVDENRPGKIVFTSSVAAFSARPGLGPYSATKHALQGIAETLQEELKPFNIKVQTINPGPFATGFNDTMTETVSHWMDDEENFNKIADIKKSFEYFLTHQYDPQAVIDAMVEIVPADTGKFRNVIPKLIEDHIKKAQADAWEKKI